MNLKDRTNLLKDSCARIPYGVKCQCLGRVGTIRSIDTFGNTEVDGFSGSIVIDVSYVKPYLFPLSSMTEEQKRELEDMSWSFDDSVINNIVECLGKYRQFVTHFDCVELINWCYKNNLDINGLIPMGLAEDATGLNIY